MSRIGKNPVVVPANAAAQVNGQDVSIKGPRGELSAPIPIPTTVELKDDEIVVNYPDDHHKSRFLHGLPHSLINNMVASVTEDYTIKMKVFGVGHRVAEKGKDLKFPLGYSHPVLIEVPEGITFNADGTIKLSTASTGKQQVRQLAANIHHLRRDGLYKGKDVRHDGEQIRHKTGETGK